MSVNEPAFELPDEIKSETDPKKIAAFYAKQAKEAVQSEVTNLRGQFRDEVNREVNRVKDQPANPAAEAQPTNTDFLTDPNAAVDRKLKNAGYVNKAEFDTMTGPLQRNAIATAEMLSRNKLTQDKMKLWDRYKGEIDQLMQQIPPHMRAEVAYWDHTFETVLGRHATELFEEGRRMGAQPPSEEVTPGAPPLEDPAKRKLNNEESRLAGKFGLSDDRYKQGQDQMGREEWPLQSLKGRR
jgi:hypothetical protein